MQRDNCIRALIILVLIGVLFIMIWSLVDPNFGSLAVWFLLTKECSYSNV